MEKLTNDTITEHFKWRYAVKKFDASKKISDSNWQTLIRSMQMSPTIYGMQKKFIVVQSPQMRKKLTEASFNQPQIETCSHLLVVTYMHKFNKEDVEGVFSSVSSAYKDNSTIIEQQKKAVLEALTNKSVSQKLSNIACEQSYMAIGFFIASAALLEIDVCPMEGIDCTQYNSILGLNNSSYKTVAVLAAGYRSADDPMQHAKKVRFDQEFLFNFVN